MGVHTHTLPDTLAGGETPCHELLMDSLTDIPRGALNNSKGSCRQMMTQRLVHLIISWAPSHSSENIALLVHGELYDCHSVFVLIAVGLIYIYIVADKAVKILEKKG